ncbi:helix-turn-helix domain-containing protein [Nocardia suismassiliense]|uniref:Helix-turn-helix domain-containing protein n=1 Tax=Nocardia suismassiliense TaxID=2077092 RepID=A0ABW6QTN9_9NOCA
MAVMDHGALPETRCTAPATLWLWPGHAVYRGPSLRLDAHSGSVHCLAVGLDAPFIVHGEGLRISTRSALIPPRMTHRLVAEGELMLFCYLDPSSARARTCGDRMTTHTGGIGITHRDEHNLMALAAHPAFDPVAAVGIACGIRELPIDPRIAAATATIRAHPAHSNSADELAAQAHLSTSRFLHLFAVHAGTSFRRYRIWARMLSVGSAIAKGMDFTRASSDAGFSSPSHFSDTFHAMCGLAPSTLLGSGTRVVILDESTERTSTGRNHAEVGMSAR